MSTTLLPTQPVASRITTLAGVVLLATVSAAAPQAKSSSAVSPTAAYDRVMKDAYPAEKPGAAVIVVKDGKTVFRKAYGMANLELGVPLQPDMVFRLGSITKQFTATAILLLAEEGKLNVQDRIEKHLPGYPTHGHTITIEHLLTHTSGIQSYTGMPGWMRDKIMTPMKPEEIIEGFKKEPMNFAPGERWAYNNSGYILLGAIIEKVSGKSYEAFVKERIFDPLGMTSSYYDNSEPIIKKRASGYTGDAKEPRNARYLSMTQPYAAGSLASTVDDLARWDQALAAGKLLKPESLAQAWKPYVLKGGEPTTYGYGWGPAKLRGRRSIAHGGGIFGFSTFALSLPDDKVYVAVLCNSDSPATDPGFLARKLAALAAGDPFPEWTEVKVDNAILERYAGVYRIDANSTRTVTVKDGRLHTQRTGAQLLPAKASSETEFFYDQSLTHFKFVVDASGRATEMLMYQEGDSEAQRAPRVADAPKERAVVQVAPALLGEYVGEYELGPGFVLPVTREGDRLMTQATGQQKLEVFASSDTEFFLKVVDARIVFTRGASGAVDGLVLHQGGREMKARKTK